MSVTAKWYRSALLGQYGTTAGRRINWTGDTVKVSLHTSVYAPAQDSDGFQSDLTDQVTGAGYSAGGAALASKTLTLVTPDVILDAADLAWAAVTITARTAAVYDSTPNTPSTNPLICYIGFGADAAVVAGTFTIVWASDGVAKHTIS